MDVIKDSCINFNSNIAGIWEVFLFIYLCIIFFSAYRFKIILCVQWGVSLQYFIMSIDFSVKLCCSSVNELWWQPQPGTCESVIILPTWEECVPLMQCSARVQESSLRGSGRIIRLKGAFYFRSEVSESYGNLTSWHFSYLRVQFKRNWVRILAWKPKIVVITYVLMMQICGHLMEHSGVGLGEQQD